MILASPSFAAEDLFTLYGKAQEALKQKDYAAMLNLSEQILALAPDHTSVQFQYARALAVNGRIDEALKVLDSIARMGGAPPAREDEAFAKIKDRKEFQSLVARLEQNRLATGRSEVGFVFPGKDFIPEGIAYDAIGKKFYVGSTYRRKIVEVTVDGIVRDFVPEKGHGLWGVIGMEVDPVRRLLWANTANTGSLTPMIDPDPVTEGKTALLKLDLKTGELIKKYETGNKENARFFNDVAIASSGDVYISESRAGEVYKISAQKDQLELMIAGGEMDFPNGLALSSDDNWLYVSHFAGITVVDLKTGGKQLLSGPPQSQLGSHDGLIFYKNSLIGIQILSGSVNRIVRFHLQNPQTVKRIEVLQVNHPLFELPTTGDMAGDEFYYIANSQLRSFDENGKIFPAEKLKDPVILKIDLLETEKEELQSIHEKGKQAHLKTDISLLLADSPPEFVSVSSGKIHHVRPEDEKKMFEEYFQGAVYSLYEDVEPPIVRVSEDGRSGWVISRLRVERTQAGKKQGFVYAGIMIYEKRQDGWVRVANVSTFEN